MRLILRQLKRHSFLKIFFCLSRVLLPPVNTLRKKKKGKPLIPHSTPETSPNCFYFQTLVPLSSIKLKFSWPNGRPLTRLDSIKQAIILFVNTKLFRSSSIQTHTHTLSHPSFIAPGLAGNLSSTTPANKLLSSLAGVRYHQLVAAIINVASNLLGFKWPPSSALGTQGRLHKSIPSLLVVVLLFMWFFLSTVKRKLFWVY